MSRGWRKFWYVGVGALVTTGVAVGFDGTESLIAFCAAALYLRICALGDD